MPFGNIAAQRSTNPRGGCRNVDYKFVFIHENLFIESPCAINSQQETRLIAEVLCEMKVEGKVEETRACVKMNNFPEIHR